MGKMEKIIAGIVAVWMTISIVAVTFGTARWCFTANEALLVVLLGTMPFAIRDCLRKN